MVGLAIVIWSSLVVLVYGFLRMAGILGHGHERRPRRRAR